MFAEDETRIKPRVRWEARRDSLIGFCGEKGTHTCSLGLEVLSEKNMVSLECWLDVQISYHMAVLVCRLFRDHYPGQKVPLHVMGSDCYEHFFSRVGGMSGYERNYDFGDLLACASGLNMIAWMEFGEDNINVGRSHAKQRTIWGKLHPLQPLEVKPNLSDFRGLQSDEEVVSALLRGRLPPGLLNLRTKKGRSKFRATKINNKNFSEYRPGEYLLETVETNAARKLVNGRPYEEISYYKEAAPYGPTFFLMSVIAELFWCNGRSTRYTMPMVYAYMRSLHGFQTNWAKVILHCLKTEIQFLQKRARAPDNTKVTPIIWAPVFVRILYTFRQTIFSGTSLEAAEACVAWIHMSKDGEIDGRALHTKYPNPIGDLKVIQERCKFTDKIPLAEPVNGDSVPVPTATMAVKLPARKRPRDVEDGNDDDDNTTPPRTVRTRLTSRTPPAVGAAAGDAGTSTVPKHIDGDSNELREFGHKIGPLLGDIVSKQLEGSLGHLLAEANAGRLLPKQVADLAKKLREAESSRTDLNDRVVALKAEVQPCKGQAASEAANSSSKKELELARKEVASAKATIAQLEVDLRKARQEVTTRANDEAKLKAQLTALAEDAKKAKVNSANEETKLQHEVSAMQKQLQGQSSTADRYIRELQLEMKKAADLDNQVVFLQGQVESHKFAAERAEKAQVALRLELNQVKTDLRMMQISGSSS
ncbi:hypothetical protein R1sor_003299 [Riccia sorocarpa]|uniref:Aminotransferase-like plant mobile domain-containing protein n=1 Tax=Riccia sorocarpa TaxID=122646 RepID=A0ABD3H167_9MARC